METKYILLAVVLIIALVAGFLCMRWRPIFRRDRSISYTRLMCISLGPPGLAFIGISIAALFYTVARWIRHYNQTTDIAVDRRGVEGLGVALVALVLGLGCLALDKRYRARREKNDT